MSIQDPNKLARYQAGLFWEYQPKKESVKAVPPNPVWLAKDYCPNYEEASSTVFPPFVEDELWSNTWERLIFDIELYPNYMCICFKSAESGKCISFQKSAYHEIDLITLQYICDHYTIVGFNSKGFDMPILALVLIGCTLKQLNDAMHMLLFSGERPFQVLKHYGIKKTPKIDNIDLIEVCPLSSTAKYHGSLKIYGGRCHSKRIQDLPIPAGKTLNQKQMVLVHWYCFNDLDNTLDLYNFLQGDIALREMLGAEYNLDLRSRSDAQVAEAIISKELTKLTGSKPQKVELPPWFRIKYDPPSYLRFKTQAMQRLFEFLLSLEFGLGGKGEPLLPEGAEEKLTFRFNDTVYKVGIGGIHSQEAKRVISSADGYTLIDRDVASFYPFIILNNSLFPEQLGEGFLTIYRNIVERRLAAKAKGKSGDKVAKRVEQGLKITINGSYGKFGNKHSVLYSPKLLLQVTLTGQLSLLYLIEKIELAGIRVVSANTDGIIIRCHHTKRDELQAIIAEWERETSFKTDETIYRCVASRSINDYMALTRENTCKGKGKLGRGITALFKNPENEICVDAIEAWMSAGTPVETTIGNCLDIRKFLTVRKVKGGGCKDGEFLGRVVRFYYSTETDSPIVYAESGNMVSNSEGAKPCMVLPDTFPPDVDHTHYVRLTKKLLGEMGFAG